MKEGIILAVVAFLTAAIYWGVEPMAHSLMHPYVPPANFNFPEEASEYGKHQIEIAQKELDAINDKDVELKKSAEQNLANVKKLASDASAFWDEVKKIDVKNGDAVKGAEVFLNAGCTACHGLKSQNMPAPFSNADGALSFGVAPPDLSDAGYLYDPLFLAAIIKDPVRALHLETKFGDDKPFPMTAFFGAGGEDMNQELADLVAYFVSIAPKTLTDREVFANSCQRCHDMRYDKLKALSDPKSLENYMGSVPPDLSIMIRARSKTYLENFINDPQKGLLGTAMPRVGLNEKAQEQVMAYMENVGDSKKEQRESLGYKILGYFLILSIFAILWKLYIWKKVH